MTWDALQTYSNGLDFFSSVVDNVDPERWSTDAPCEGWSALDVLGHVGEGTEMGIRILSGGEMIFQRHEPPSSIVTGDPNDWWSELARAARDALAGVEDLDREVDSPMGKRTVRDGLSFPAVDLFIHGWDIATATGQSVTLPVEAIEFIEALFEKVPEEISRRPGVMSPKIQAPEEATPTEAIIAFTGRDPRWVPSS